MDERAIEWTVPASDAGGRADKVLAGAVPEVSRARLQRAFDEGRVLCDDVPVGKKAKLRAGQTLCVRLERDRASEEPPRPVAMPLAVVYEDASLIALNKAAGMTVHPGNGTGEDTLAHGLLHHCGETLREAGPPDRPGIVHRLDKETSGLIVAAKTAEAHRTLSAAFRERRAGKTYRALALGSPEQDSGISRERIGRHPVARTRMAVTAGGREARTDWRVVERFGERAVEIECAIHTGRTHQVRVHLSHMGFPLLGDAAYGFKASRLPGIEVPRVMLHAVSVCIDHPVTGETLRLEAPVPEDLRIARQALREI